MHLDPQALSQPDRYKLLIGGIVPRPIAWVSTMSPDGRLNLAPFSFFAGVSSEPMSLLFCPANKPDGEPKDTLRNLLAPGTAGTGTGGTGVSPVHPRAEASPHLHPHFVGQFVVNIVPHALARPMAACAEPLPYGQSEFDLAGLATAPSLKVKPPRVAKSPLSFECETLQIIRLAPGVPAGGNIIIGRVVSVHAMDGLVNERHHIDPALLDAIGRMGGLGYCTTRDRFDMPMGKSALT